MERNRAISGGFSDGASGTRTRDLLIANQALSQLSYSPEAGEFTACHLGLMAFYRPYAAAPKAARSSWLVPDPFGVFVSNLASSPVGDRIYADSPPIAACTAATSSLSSASCWASTQAPLLFSLSPAW